MSVSAATSPPRAIRLDAAFFERLFEGSGLAVFACDPDGRIRGWNSLGQVLLGPTRCAAGDLHIRDVLPVEDRAVMDEHIRECITTLQSVEFRSRMTRDDQPVDYAVWISPIHDEVAGLQGVSVWFHDITDRMRLRRSLRKNERLNSLGEMSGAVAHHYSNLLCSIATSLEFALNLNSVAAMRRGLQRTAEAVGRATHLTQQLLAFAKADYRRTDMADLTEVILIFCDDEEARLTSLGVRLDVQREPIPTIPVPREAFQVILKNLTDNAIDAMPDGGVLRLDLQRLDEHHVRLSVIDSGPGIPADRMERLFEPFYTTKGELCSGGSRKSGMGLAVAYGLISELHGTIGAANTPEGGARFDITLPIEPI